MSHTVSVIVLKVKTYVAECGLHTTVLHVVIEVTVLVVWLLVHWSKARFSYQEYFERMDKQAERFGQPVAAFLGSIEKHKQLLAPSISVVRTMSLVPLEMTVPPTLVAFGVTTADSRKVLSPEFKAVGENIYSTSQVKPSLEI